MNNTDNIYVSVDDIAADTSYDEVVWIDSTSPLHDRFNELEKQLSELQEFFLILKRSIRMEDLHPELKTAYDEYNRIKEKLEVFDILGRDNGTD